MLKATQNYERSLLYEKCFPPKFNIVYLVFLVSYNNINNVYFKNICLHNAVVLTIMLDFVYGFDIEYFYTKNIVSTELLSIVCF